MTRVQFRYAVLWAIVQLGGRPVGVDDVVAQMQRLPFVRFRSRPGKQVSDALRYHVNHGMVTRLGRNQYLLGHVPKTTWWRATTTLGYLAAAHARGETEFWSIRAPA